MKCPRCGGECDAEFVDIGVGMQQVTPYGCRDCEWYEGQERTKEVAMGQAFDAEGNVLGEAYGNTKREVLDKLEQRHPDAAEIRIRAATDRAAAQEAKERHEADAVPETRTEGSDPTNPGTPVESIDGDSSGSSGEPTGISED